MKEHRLDMLCRIGYALAVSSAVCLHCCLHAFAVETFSSSWNVVDVGTGKKPAFAFDANDNIHLMAFAPDDSGIYYDSASSMHGPWSLTEIASSFYYGPGDLVVDHSGNVHIAWHDHDFDGGSPGHVIVSPTGVITDYSIVSPGHNGWDNALAVDSAGVVHQTSINPLDFDASDGLEYGKFNGTDWSGYGSIPGTGATTYAFATTLDTDSNNYAHMAYTLGASFFAPGDLKYVQDSDLGPAISTIVTGGINRFASLAIDSQDRPHVAWMVMDPNDLSMGSIEYGVLDNGTWTFDTVGATVENVSLGAGRKQVSLVLDGNDQPHIAYGDKRSINYATNSGSSWDTTPLAASDEDLYNGLVELQLNSQGEPTILFFNSSNLVRLAAIRGPGDFDGDGNVDGADFLEWQRGESPSTSDLLEWQMHYGGALTAPVAVVPEPASVVYILVASAVALLRRP